MRFDSKKTWPYLIALLVFIIVTAITFLPQFQGKVVEMGDIVQYSGMAKEATDFREKSGEVTLWTNAMFGGMPTYQISAPNDANKFQYFQKLLALGFPRPAGYFITGLISFFILLLTLRVNPWLSIVGSFMFAFTSSYFILYEAGHTSKVLTIFTAPLLLAGMLSIFRKNYLLGFGLYTIGLGVNVFSNHPQMTYYFGLTLILLVLGFGINSILNKDYTHILKSALLLLVGTLLAFGGTYSRLKSTFEYGKDTMRGTPILQSKEANKPTKKDGLEYDYAMGWSNNSVDLISSFIPYFAGGGSGEWVSKKSKLARTLRQGSDFQAPTYWGGLPSTSGPNYLGIVAFFLFVFGMFVYQGKLKWWLLGAFIFTLLISLGKNFALLNETLFNYLPMFNKFRTPNSVLAVTSIFVPILAMLGIQSLLDDNNKERHLKSLYISFGIVGGFCALMALLGSSFFSLSNEGDEQYKNIIEPLTEYRASMLSASAWKSFMLCAAAAGILWMFIKNKISLLVGSIILLLVTMIDLLPVGKNYLNSKDFVSAKKYDKNFEPRPVDTQILQDKDPNYRVYDATVNTFNSASTSYYHKTIGGYSAVKLQRYQDMIENHISKGNQNVLNMLNTKYFIMNGQDKNPIVQQNPAAYGNAWFVDSIMYAKDANEEIDSLKNISNNFAVVHNEFKSYCANLNPQKNGEIKLTSYAPNKLEYSTNSTSDQLAVFSEVWYGPNKGWQAYVDDKPADHIRANYTLRAMKIPAGQHKIRFEFKPADYYNGEKISLISSLLSVLLSLGSIAYFFYKKFN